METRSYAASGGGGRLPAGHTPDAFCVGCDAGLPTPCGCGGRIHGDLLFSGCDRCDEPSPPSAWTVGGESHAAGDGDCVSCPAGHPVACGCGGLVHARLSAGGLFCRCDRCGGEGVGAAAVATGDGGVAIP